MRPLNLKTRAATLAALVSGEWLSVRHISQRTGVDYDLASHYLRLLCKSGEAERRKETVQHVANGSSRCFVYRAAGATPVAGQMVPPVYRNLRLEETLTDYDRTLHSFEALCMLVNR